MKTCGIIVEYNPFHLGHIHHLKLSKELTNADLIIAIMSGNFSQRGEPTIADKFNRSLTALKHGVDLIIELPTILTCQCGSIFASSAIDLLKLCEVDYVVFGSETGNLKQLQEIASLPINVEHLKTALKNGESFPSAYGLFPDSIYPNDRLAIHYLRALKNSAIKPLAIQRLGNYNAKVLSPYPSASSLRLALRKKIDISKYCPMQIVNPIFSDSLYPYLRKLLLLEKRSQLKNIFLVNEGIEKLLSKNALNYDDFDTFMEASISKRYTYSRVQRTCLQIMLHNQKDDVINLNKPAYLRILGFNQKGRNYLKYLSKKVHVVSRFKDIPSSYRIFEEKANYLYASLFPKEIRRTLLQKELSGPIIVD